MEDTTKSNQDAAAAAEQEMPLSALALRSLADYATGTIPTIFYVSEFISDSEQSQLLHNIYQAPAPKWKTLKNRWLQNWGGVVHEKGLLPQTLPSWLTRITDRIYQCQRSSGLPHQDGPAYYPVVAIISLASPVVIDFTPHQRLKEQEDTDPQDLQAHELPAPAEMESNDSGSHECGATNESDPASSLLMLMPCSLLIFKDHASTDYLHGIQDHELHNLDKVENVSQCPEPELKQQHSDCILWSMSMEAQRGKFRRAPQESLTCRLVLKVHKNKLFKI